jgi:hypothetical protein
MPWPKGKPFSEATRLKLSRVQKGHKVSAEARRKIGLAQKGLKRSPEAREKMRLANLGRIMPEWVKEKIRLTLTGRPRDEKTKEKLRKPRRPECLKSFKKDAEARLIRSRALKGRKKTDEHRRNMSGPHSARWKGGVTPEHRKIRNSLEYKIWRKSVFERDDFTCRFCGVRGVRLNADHIKSFALYPELRFVVENGRTLCEPCHKTTETFGSGQVKRKEKIEVLK